MQRKSQIQGWVITRSLTGTPPANYNGSISLKVGAFDSLEWAYDTFILTVNAVNDAPVVAQTIGNISIDEDTNWNYTVPLGTFTDVETAQLTYSAERANGSALPSWLTFNSSTRVFSGHPPADFNGQYLLRVIASDGDLTETAGFTLNIKPINDPPIAKNDSGISTTSTTSLSIAASSLLSNDLDVDGDTLSLVSVGGAGNGSVSLSSNKQTVIFTPHIAFVGGTSFTYTMTDGINLSTAIVRLNITAPFVTPSSRTYNVSGTFTVPFYNEITINIYGSGGGGGHRGYYCCGSENGYWRSGDTGETGSTTNPKNS